MSTASQGAIANEAIASERKESVPVEQSPTFSSLSLFLFNSAVNDTVVILERLLITN